MKCGVSTVNHRQNNMKKLFILLSAASILICKAQIPNYGFENWTIDTETGIEIPAAPWVTNNLQSKPSGATFNPVTKSTDHYPESVGNFSIRMENNISFVSESGETMPFRALSYGYSTTAKYPGHTGPAFPITGHPTSLCGYYKFIQQNNDTMGLGITLYLNGNVVAETGFYKNETVANWTSFTVTLPSYVNADSAQIGIAAFYSPFRVHGNSVVYVDNLSFDNLIMGLNDPINSRENLNIYPNPASDKIRLNFNQTGNTKVNIYSLSGACIKTVNISSVGQEIDIRELYAGYYIVEVESDNKYLRKSLIVH